MIKCILSFLLISTAVLSQNDFILVQVMDIYNNPVPEVYVNFTGGVDPQYTTNSGQCRVKLLKDMPPGSKISLVIKKDDWEIVNVKDLEFFLPKDPLQNPIHIVIKPIIIDKGLIKLHPIIENKIDPLLIEDMSYYAEINSWETEFKYSLGLLLETSFFSIEYNKNEYISSIGELKLFVDDNDNLEFEINEKYHNNKKYFIIIIKSSKFKSIPKELNVQVNGRMFKVHIKNTNWQNYKEDKRQWKSSFLTGSIFLSNPDWIILKGARFLKTKDNNRYLLELKVENMSKSALLLDYLSIEGQHDWGANCAGPENPYPWQTIVMNLKQISVDSTIFDGSWTEINSIPFEIEAKFREANCGNYTHDLLMKVPTQYEIPAKTNLRLSYLIEFTSRFRIDRGWLPPPSDLTNWDFVTIKLFPNLEMYPKSFTIENR